MSKILTKAREYEREAVKNVSECPRPNYHFTPPIGWMNDPNGFSEYKGEYHLFFQYYPYATHWDSMHWGHAKSEDFICWKYLPTALAPDQEYDDFGVFSGTAMEDGDRQIIIYTGVVQKVLENGEKSLIQNQCIAVGDGTNYRKLAENPVISGDLLPKGDSCEDFRDPKIWKEGNRYYAVAGNKDANGSGQIVLFYSDDLKQWSFGSVLVRCNNELGEMWECPDFFALDGKQVLLISPTDMDVDGMEFHNGSNVVFLLGEYDREKMKFTRNDIQCVDYGLDFYAAQTMFTSDGRRIMIAWMQSWDNNMYSKDYKWSGMMTVPRELFIKDGHIFQTPVTELQNYYSNRVVYSNICIEKEVELSGIKGRSVDLSLRIKGDNYEKCRIKVASDEKYYSEIVYDRVENTLTFDRTHSGYRRDVISTRKMLINRNGQDLELRILVDRYSVEIFVNGGRQAMTSLIFTGQSAEKITFESDGQAWLDVTKYDIDVKR